MRKSSLAEDLSDNVLAQGSLNWLLHARYVRGEHSLCINLADHLQTVTENKHIYAYYIKGSVLADAGRTQEAMEKFHSCLRLQPQDPEPLRQVAKCLFRQERYQLALEAYLEADKLTKHPDPDIYCALENNLVTHKKKSNKGKLESVLTLVASLNPAECCWKLGDPEHGVEWARSAVQAEGGERAGALLARLLLACDNMPAALAAYDQALSGHACGAGTLAAAGALRLRAGDARRAFQLLGEALAQQPTQHEAALALAAMMHQHKDTDAALARLKTALGAHPACVAAHSNLGLALLDKKKYVAALTCLQRAVWSAPLSARAAHNLGLALLLCKRPASAFCRLATAAALQPNQPYTVLLIAIALERLGDERADAAYARAVTLAPEDALVRLNQAGRFARVGMLEEAVAAAEATAHLLQAEQKTNAQLANSLGALIILLHEAGVEFSKMPTSKPPEDVEVSDSVEEIDTPQNKLEPDEV